MSKTKKIFLLISVILVIFALILFFFLRQAPSTQTTNPEQPSTNLFRIPSPTDLKMALPTPQGATITTNNVYKDSLRPLSQNGVAFKDNPDYYAAFYPDDQGFLIVLQNSDIESARAKAESEFIQTLGITKEQACTLKVSITIPADVSDQYSGKVYGLSFCPGAKTF